MTSTVAKKCPTAPATVHVPQSQTEVAIVGPVTRKRCSHKAAIIINSDTEVGLRARAMVNLTVIYLTLKRSTTMSL